MHLINIKAHILKVPCLQQLTVHILINLDLACATSCLLLYANNLTCQDPQT